jgi:hypothetical protein
MLRNFIRLAAVLIALVARSASAVEVLDQQYDVGMSSFADTAFPFSAEVGQTFTVGVAGTLSRIEVQINRFNNLGGSAILTVYNTAAGVPTTSLGTASLSTALIPPTGFAYQSFDVSSFAIPVSIGNMLAFGIKSSGDSGYFVRAVPEFSTYAGGKSKFRSTGPPPGAWQDYNFEHDNGFKTYVNAAAPATKPGDFNDDGVINAADYPVWRKHLNDPSEAALNGNGDGMNGVDEGDYNLWRQNFAVPAAGQAGQVPEPSTWLLCTVAALGASYRRCRSLSCRSS